MGPEGAASLAAMLKDNQTITYLQLGCMCFIGDSLPVVKWFRCILVYAMRHVAVSWCVAGNEIGTEGAASLAGMLKDNRTIKTLWLDCVLHCL